MKKKSPDDPSCSQNAHDKGDGRIPTLVLCSRNARLEKGLVRRPHVDQHGYPSRNEKRASLEGSLVGRGECSSDARTEGRLVNPLGDMWSRKLSLDTCSGRPSSTPSRERSRTGAVRENLAALVRGKFKKLSQSMIEGLAGRKIYSSV
jgi:hypothetical protein